MPRGDQPVIQDLVIADVENLKRRGHRRHEARLQPFNGKNALQDHYEQLLASVMYLKQLLIEEEMRAATEQVHRSPRGGGSAEATGPGATSMPAGIDPERVAQMIAHRAVSKLEHDPAQGKYFGCCVICGTPWPCTYAGPVPAAVRSERTTP